MEQNNPQGQAVWMPPQDGEVNVVTQSRDIRMFRLTEQELDSLCTAGNYKNLDMTLFALCGGVCVTLGATIMTVDLKTQLLIGAFTGALIAFGVGTLFFGVRAYLAWQDAKTNLNRIKQAGGPALPA
jgi:hypothetical protein